MIEAKEPCYKRINTAMQIRGMKQVDLMEATGIGKSAISQYVSGKFVPKQRATYLIAKALNVSEAWLMGYDVPMNRNESKPTEDDGLTKARRELIQFAKNVPEDQCGRVLQMMKLMLGDDQ